MNGDPDEPTEESDTPNANQPDDGPGMDDSTLSYEYFRRQISELERIELEDGTVSILMPVELLVHIRDWTIAQLEKVKQLYNENITQLCRGCQKRLQEVGQNAVWPARGMQRSAAKKRRLLHVRPGLRQKYKGFLQKRQKQARCWNRYCQGNIDRIPYFLERARLAINQYQESLDKVHAAAA